MEFWVTEEIELRQVAKQILRQAAHSVFLLKGELGAGKTALVKAFVQEMNSKDIAMSPTYTLLNEYHTPEGKVFHFDLYRLKETEEALDFGIEEYLDSKQRCFIEWPMVIRPLLDNDFHQIEIKQVSEKRNIHFS